MPLVKIFTKHQASVIRSGVYDKLLHLFKAEPAVLNVVVQEAETIPCGLLVDVRAKAKEDRTPEAMASAAQSLATYLADEVKEERDGVRVRIELFDPKNATSAWSAAAAVET